MKKCPKCGATLPDQVAFCSKCGVKIEAPSPSPSQPSPPPPPPPPSQPPAPPAQPAPPVPPVQPPQKSGALKWVLIILAIIIILFLIAGAGCWFIGRKALKTIEQEAAKFEEGVMPSLEELSKEISEEVKEEVEEVEVKKKVTEPLVAPSEVVEPYMLYTLGTVPNSLVDYDIAKQYLTSGYKKEFTDASFVPLSYCIQNGPDDVRIKSEKISDSTATVRVSAQYGGSWQDMWDFKLAIQDEEWKISGIKCL